MGRVEFRFPIKGEDTNNPIEKQPLQTSPDLENVRPYDQLEIRMRGGQRPGCRKWGAGSRIGGGDYQIDKLVAASRGSLLGDLSTEELCTEAGYYWWGGACHTYPELPGTTLASVWKCLEDSDKLSIIWVYDTGGIVVDVDVDGSGNVYVGGTRAEDEDGQTASVWKLNSSGVKQWEYDTGAAVYRIRVDGSGNVYVAGDRGTDEDSATATCWKLNSSGVKQWEYDSGEDGSGRAVYGLALDSSVNVYIVGAGTTDEDSDSGSFRKLNNSGVKQWIIDTTANRTSTINIAVDSSDNIYTDSVTALRFSQYDTDGTEQWDYGTGNNAIDANIDNNGDLIIVSIGGTDEDGTTGNIRKLNSSGVRQWTASIAGIKDAVGIDGDDNLYLVGWINSNTSFWKLNSSGTEQWNDDFTINTFACFHDGTNIYVGGSRFTP